MNKLVLGISVLALAICSLTLAIVLQMGQKGKEAGEKLEHIGKEIKDILPPKKDKKDPFAKKDPPPDPIPELTKITGAKKAELDQAIRGLAAFPSRTREAILDLAQYSEEHPTLLAELARHRKDSPEDLDKYLNGSKYEPELQWAAAVVLVEAPDTIDRMRETPELVRVVGKAWSTPPGRVLISTILDASATKQDTARNTAADRWSARLKDDPKAMQQYTQLVEDYTQRVHGGDEKADATWKTYHYGIHKDSAGYVVTDVPSTEVINYALAEGTKYQALVAALLQQYFNGANQDSYNAAVGGWYSANGDAIPQSTRDDNSAYYALLQELSQLAQALAQYASENSSGDTGSGSGDGSGSGSNGYGDSYSSYPEVNAAAAYVAANAARYPRLTDWRAKNPAPKLGSPADQLLPKDGLPKDPFPKLPKDDFPKLPKDKPPLDPIKKPTKTPFSDQLKNIPPADRARPAPEMQNPFDVAKLKPQPMGKQPEIPHNLFRGAPSIGQQMTRAPMQMRSAWSPPRGGPRPGKK